MRTLASLESPISSLLVSPDGSTVVTASTEGIGFLDLTSGQRSVTALEEEVSRLTWGPDGLLAGTLSGEVWSIRRAPVRLFEAIDEEISGIAATSDGTIAVCGGEPFAVATFGPHGNEEWRGEPYKWPYCVRFSPDGNLLAVATWDGNLFVFDAHDLPDELAGLDGEYAGGPIFDARFLPGERVLVVGASFVRIWDRGTSSYIASRELPAEAFACAVSPDGGCAVVSTNDQRLRLFALPDLTELGDLAAGPRGNKELSYFPDYAEFCHVKGPATIRTLAFHPDGTRVFGSTEDHRIVEFTRAELQRTASSASTSTSARSRDPKPAAPPSQLSLALPSPPPPSPTRPSAKPAAPPADGKPNRRTARGTDGAATRPTGRRTDTAAARPTARRSDGAPTRSTARRTDGAATRSTVQRTDGAAARQTGRRTDSAATSSTARRTDGAATRSTAQRTDGAAARQTGRRSDSAATSSTARRTDGAAARQTGRRTDEAAARQTGRRADGTAPRPTARRTNSAAARPLTRRADGAAIRANTAKTTPASSGRKSTGRPSNGAPARKAKTSVRNAVASKPSKKSRATTPSKATAVAKGSKPSTNTATRPRAR